MNNKKGYIHHPVLWAFIAAIVIGMVLMYLICKGVIPIDAISCCKATVR